MSMLDVSSLCFASSFSPLLPRRLSTVALVSCQPCRIRQMTTASYNGSLAEHDEHKPIFGTRKVVEHIALFQMKQGFDEIQEKDMLDHLYTLQYQLKGIISVSLGTITSKNPDGCTHALFSRFPSRDALKSYYESPIQWSIANEYIIPFYNGLICVDYEADVEDDILPIFRRGEEFEQGIEYMVILQMKSNVDPKRIAEGFYALSHLFANELGSYVIQHTSGANFSDLSKGYTHGMVTRFPSEIAKNICLQHSSYKEVMETLETLTEKMLLIDYPISPIGTTTM